MRFFMPWDPAFDYSERVHHCERLKGRFNAIARQTPGNMGRYIADCRSQGIHNVDLGISKRVEFKESMFLEIRGEFYNAFNMPRFGMPNTTFGSDSFGVINSQYKSPTARAVGLPLRFLSGGVSYRV
jgi:hypothetical protein